jgi:glycosyltransferase involved in cell wall biosynthesis
MRKTLQKKSCVVTDELSGPDYNGGIGTACYGLATALAAAGHQVDVLYTRVAQGSVNCSFGSFQDHVDALARRSVRLLSIAQEGPWNDFPAKSFSVLNHLQASRYDLVFFNDTHGTGFYPLLSRRTGNPLLSDTRMCVVTHSATQWIFELNGEPVPNLETIRLLEMERKSIELADVVISPSSYLVRKYKEYGWRFPADTQIRRYMLPDAQLHRSTAELREIDELVFFGRLERRKGIDLFCSALDRLKYALRGKTVTFLGKDTLVNGSSTLEKIVMRSAAWPFEVRVMPNYDRENALNYLRGGRRVAVMPSLEDNSPCAIQECLELGIPFIASSGSGGEELIAAEARERCCFAPTVAALSRKIEQVLEQGAAPAQLSFDPEENERDFLRWLDEYLSEPGASKVRPRRSLARPRKPAAPSIALLIAGCNGFKRSNASFHLGRIAAAFPGGQRSAMLCTDDSSQPASTAVNNLSTTDYEPFARGLRGDKADFVCIWDAELELNPDWLVRARDYLAGAPDCAAVTGLATTGTAHAPRLTPPHLSLQAVAPALRQPIVGPSDALRLLSQETNNGFVLMRGAAFQTVRHCLPWDPVLARLKPPDHWIDELLHELRQRGERIELIPDLPSVPNTRQRQIELFQKGAARRLAAAAATVPGSHSALIHRFAVDRQINAEARRDTFAVLDQLARQTNVPAQLWQTAGGVSNAFLDNVAATAFATGKVELAKETLTYLASARGARAFDFSHPAEGFWEAMEEELSVAVLFERGQCFLANHRVQPRVCLEGGQKAMLLCANCLEEGLVRVACQADLTNCRHFSSAVRALSAEPTQLRFHVTIAAENGSARLHKECMAAGNAPLRFDFSLPEDLRQLCTVTLIVESRGEQPAAAVANALWINPCFTRNRPN